MLERQTRYGYNSDDHLVVIVLISIAFDSRQWQIWWQNLAPKLRVETKLESRVNPMKKQKRDLGSLHYLDFPGKSVKNQS